MRSVQDVLAEVLADVGPLPPLDVVLADAAGCVLVEDLVTEWPLPRQPVAAGDGYAVRAEDTLGAGTDTPVVLPVAHDVAVDATDRLRLVPGTTVRISSGGPMPEGADAVVPLEHTDRGAARVAVTVPARPGQQVRPTGVDAPTGEVLVPRGTRLAARQLALAAGLGRPRLRVHPTPRVVILAVGDELVDARTPAREGAVHDATGPGLVAAVRDAGAAPYRVGVLADDRTTLREAVEDQLVRADLLLLTGGLSATSRDTVRDVLGPMGRVRFDQVAMHPGRRLGFGRIGDGVPVFALPGHPVAAQVAFEVLVRPALRAMAGSGDLHRVAVTAAATEGWPSPAGLRQFLPVTVRGDAEDGYLATPQGDPEQLSTTALARANALAVVPEDVTVVRAGDVVHCMVLGS